MVVGALWVFFLVSSSAIFLLYALSRQKPTPPHHGRLPPGPRPLPIIGNLLLLGDKPHHSLSRLAKTHGPLMSLKLGRVTTLVVSSPEMAREVLQKNDLLFCNRSILDAVKSFGYHEGSVVWLPVDKPWKDLRKICNTQLFMSQKINDNQGIRQKKIREVVMHVRERGLAGEAVDIGEAAYTAVLNSLSNTLFSIDMGDDQTESSRNFRRLVWGILEVAGKPNLSDFFPVLAAIDIQGRRRRFGYLITKLFKVFDELIDQRMEGKREQATTNDFLDSLIQCHIGNEDLQLNRQFIKSLLLDLFVAGTDTTSNTIEWAMAELLHNPSSMEKARAELFEKVGNGRDVNESDIDQLPYLRAIVKETLRLHPPVPFLVPHKAERSVELCGYTIPAGTRVLVNVWAMGRDGDVWTDPELFMPERFLQRDLDYRGRDFELIPFGAGRRICPGLPLAFPMIHLVIASLILPFSWVLPEGMEPRDIDMDEKFGFTLAKATPLRTIPVLR